MKSKKEKKSKDKQEVVEEESEEKKIAPKKHKHSSKKEQIEKERKDKEEKEMKEREEKERKEKEEKEKRDKEEKDRIEPGYIYICPPDYHILVEKDQSFSLDDSEKVNYSRPSIDVVFKSAADIYKDQLICFLLSGANADGAEGLKYAKSLGSVTIVQKPEDAQVPYMPQQALKIMNADHILDGNQIAGFLNSLSF